MSQEQTDTIRQLRALLRAYDRYSRAVGGPRGDEGKLDAEFERLVVRIESRWASSLDDFLRKARQALADGRGAPAGAADARHALTAEAILLRDLRVDVERLEWLYGLYLEDATAADRCPATSAELIERLRSLHERAKERIDASRSLGRKAKKRRKRAIAQGVASLAVSVGAYITNVNHPGLAPWSYALGGSALHQALRDIVGTKEA